ncbi:hypothetical protein ACH5RR_000314 [Cinchona calisaya]|uniref:peptidylprolyl isomerase n=1 Tax=Cinchona calisaya TaxID=153742 RepID=A0ABD3B0E7_9GENT
MAFWGIEVILGNPVAHSFDKVRRRLRISRVTLGIGSAIQKSLVQYNVGNKSPVFLCALLSDKTELCHLDLEFEEADDVFFSVIVPGSVFLPGYYVSNDPLLDLNSDTESYGEDIVNRETDESGHHGNEDDFEDCFIDYDDEEMLDKEMIREREGCKRIKWKKIQIIDSDDLSTSQENEDDDNQLLYVTAERSDNKADCGNSGHVLKVKANAITDKELKSELRLVNITSSKRKWKEQSDDAKTLEGSISNRMKVLKQDKVEPVEAKADKKHQEIQTWAVWLMDINLRNQRKIEEAKSQENKENSKTSESLLSANVTRNPSISCQVGTLSNGLVVEELALCDQDGKIAALGKKVKV